ncbi:MAG: DNA primase, partial [Bacteroidales bacterium]|nr:DNA primase [Bacteroidales bacterium]
GVNMIGLCPFHNEKTPSFTVSPAKGIFKCFGCGEAGSSIDFVMKHEHFTYPQALKHLAGKYGIEIEEEEQTPEQIKAENEREGLFTVTKFAAKHFVHNIHETNEGKSIGLAYFNERGMHEHIVNKFELGYCPDRWDDLLKAATDAGHSLDYLISSGLVIKGDNGKTFDRFRGRVIFPIHNISGRVIGFGGRILDSAKSKAKYLNSPESIIYNKSESLYGIYFAKSAIIKQDNCFLVEGYTDVTSLHQSGIENVVASSGTSLTSGQIKLIRRFSQNITILYDGDAAGIKASFRGIDMIVEEGMNVRVVLFPDGEDPDSFARAHTSEELEEYVTKSSQDFITFKSGLLSKEAGDDPVKKSEVVRNIITTIALVPDQLKRLFFIRECSNLLNVGEQMLVNEVNKIRRAKFFKDHKQEDIPIPEPKAPTQVEKIVESDIYQEREVIRILLNFGGFNFKIEDSELIILDSGTETSEEEQETELYNVAEFIVDELSIDQLKFEDGILQQIFDEYAQAIETEAKPSEQFFINHSDDNIRKTAINLLSEAYELSKNWEEVHKISITMENAPTVVARAAVSSVYSLKIRKVEAMKMALMEKIKTTSPSEEDLDLYMRQARSLDEVRNKMNRELGRIVLK